MILCSPAIFCLRAAKRLTAGMTLLLLLVAGFAPWANALTPADNQEIQHFTLSENFLQRYAAAASDARQQIAAAANNATPDAPDTPDSTQMAAIMSSLDSMTAEINRSPAKVATLKRHGLTAREATIGGLVLMRARIAESVSADPTMAKFVDARKTPSAANMAFYRAHKAEIAKIMTDDE